MLKSGAKVVLLSDSAKLFAQKMRAIAPKRSLACLSGAGQAAKSAAAFEEKVQGFWEKVLHVFCERCRSFFAGWCVRQV